MLPAVFPNLPRDKKSISEMDSVAEALQLLWIGRLLALTWRGLYFPVRRQSSAAQKLPDLPLNFILLAASCAKPAPWRWLPRLLAAAIIGHRSCGRQGRMSQG